MAEDLFSVVFNGYAAPARLRIEQQDAELTKVKTEAARTDLANQAAMQKGLQAIYGPGGEISGAQAILQARGLAPSDGQPDPNLDKKLQATAQLMFSTGNVADGTALLNTLSLNKSRQATAQRAALSASATGMKMIGGALGAVTDQPSYTAVLSDLQEQGVNLGTLNLTGDFETDRPAIASLANASLTQAQRLSAVDRQAKEADINQYRNTRLTQIDQSLSQGNARLDLASQRLGLSQKLADEKIQEDDKRDARAQAGLEDKRNKSVVHEVAQAMKVTPTESLTAQEIFSSDEATAVIPQQLRNVYSRQAALRAKQIIGQRLATQPAGTSYTPEEFDAAMRQAIGEMREQGRFSPNRSAGLLGTGIGATDSYQYQPPKGGAQASNGKPQSGASAPLPKAVQAQYKSASDVKSAYQAGKLTREQAAELLRANGWAQ